MTTLELTRKLVAIKSTNPFLSYLAEDGTYAGISCENEINNFLENLLTENGFKVEKQEIESTRSIRSNGHTIDIPKRFNILAEKGEGNQSLLFFGHTDTVDIKLGWKSDPFELTTRPSEPEWKHYGLGANDMKGGIAAMLNGIINAKIPSGIKLKVALLVDEEYWSFGAHKLIGSEFLKDVKYAFVSEIADELVPPNQMWIGVGRLGRTEFEIEVVGKSCHGADASISGLSINAVHEAIILQSALLKKYLNKNHQYIDGSLEISSSQYISMSEGGRAILSVPEYSKFTIDKSFIPGENVGTQLKEIDDIIKELKASRELNQDTQINVRERNRPTPPCKPYALKLDDHFVTKVSKILGNLSITPKFGIGRSVADENRIAETGIPTLILSPNGQGSHTNEEWVDARSLEQLALVYRNIVENW